MVESVGKKSKKSVPKFWHAENPKD